MGIHHKSRVSLAISQVDKSAALDEQVEEFDVIDAHERRAISGANHVDVGCEREHSQRDRFVVVARSYEQLERYFQAH